MINITNHPSKYSKAHYEMTTTSKRSLIFESVTMIRISIHPTGEGPNQHIICVAPRVSCTTIVPTRSKLGLCSRDEVLAPSDRPTRPSSWAASFSLHKPPQSREGQFNKVVTKLLGLLGPIKPDMRSVQFKSYPLGPKRRIP
jgi:hypothetical protein